MTIRVRMAPSPTGTLHVGTARTALFNWLYARHHGSDGVYVLRIEDTDQERSTIEHVDQALRVLRWLGLNWEEGPQVEGPYGPYFQSERFEQYSAALADLRERGLAYPCFCTPDELKVDREAAQAAKRPFVYTGRCAGMSADDATARIDAGDDYAVRFRVPTEGSTVVNDLILGDMSFENALIGDFVIARSDGSPLYNFANVVDDLAMKITHVIRGNDHLSNTPKQILLYQAMDADVPLFAHAPLIVGADGSKLSKRDDGATTVEEFMREGYIAAALRNGLALLGWNRDGDTTYMTTDEIVEAFDITRVKKNPATFDRDKLRNINGLHLRALDAKQFADEYAAWRDRCLLPDDADHDAAWAATPEQVAYLCHDKIDVLSQVPGLVGFLLEPCHITGGAWEKLAKVDQAPQVLDAAIAAIGALDPAEDGLADRVETSLRSLCEELELKPRVVFGPIRCAVTGRTITPGLFESIAVLGIERATDRLRAARARLDTVGV